jgi:hypothetical protein
MAIKDLESPAERVAARVVGLVVLALLVLLVLAFLYFLHVGLQGGI